LGLRHCGQLTRAGADVFHCDRRDLVLLRDIRRLGTATLTLLTVLSSVVRFARGGFPAAVPVHVRFIWPGSASSRTT